MCVSNASLLDEETAAAGHKEDELTDHKEAAKVPLGTLISESNYIFHEENLENLGKVYEDCGCRS